MGPGRTGQTIIEAHSAPGVITDEASAPNPVCWHISEPTRRHSAAEVAGALSDLLFTLHRLGLLAVVCHEALFGSFLLTARQVSIHC